MQRKLLALLFACLLLWPATQADVELVFGTGDTIKGKDVRREGDDYVLTTYDGGTVRMVRGSAQYIARFHENVRETTAGIF